MRSQAEEGLVELTDMFSWEVSDGALGAAILSGMIPHMTGYKKFQAMAWVDFMALRTRFKEYVQEERRKSFTLEERYLLLKAAFNVRKYAGGGMKEWKKVWVERLEEMEMILDFPPPTPEHLPLFSETLVTALSTTARK